MTTFFFVRHGVTSHTNKKLSGWLPDIHLTDEGRKQSEIAASSLARAPFKAVYSSPIARCAETARIVAAPHRLAVRTRRDLGEVEYGRWTGRSFKSLYRTKLWSVVQRWPSGFRFPEGEALRDVQSRSVAALEELRSKHRGQTICVVSHADVIRLVVAHCLGLHMDLFQRIVIGPASITVVDVNEYGPRVITVGAPPGASFS